MYYKETIKQYRQFWVQKREEKKTKTKKRSVQGLELGLCTRKSKVLPWSHTRRTFSLQSMVHNFHPQISVYTHFCRHFTPTILIHWLHMCTHEWAKKHVTELNFATVSYHASRSSTTNAGLFFSIRNKFFLKSSISNCVSILDKS